MIAKLLMITMASFSDAKIAECEEDRDYEQAAELSEELGLFERAIQNYELAGKFEEADRLLEKVGHVNRPRKIYERIIISSHYDLSFTKDTAAVLAKRIGDENEAARLYKDSMWFFDRFDEYSLRAAKLAERMEKYDVAISYYQKSGFHHRAIKLAEKIGRNQESINVLRENQIRYHENHGNVDISVALAEQNFGIQRAIRVFKNTRKIKSGAEYVIKELGTEAAIKFCEDEYAFEDAVELAEKKSLERAVLVYEKGTRHYIDAGMSSWAVSLAKKSGNLKLLKSVCEECIRHLQPFRFQCDAAEAAKLAEMIGDHGRAKEFRETEKTLPFPD